MDKGRSKDVDVGIDMAKDVAMDMDIQRFGCRISVGKLHSKSDIISDSTLFSPIS